LTLQNSFLYLPEVGEQKFDSSKLGQKQLLLSSISSKNKRFLNAFDFLKLIFWKTKFKRRGITFS